MSQCRRESDFARTSNTNQRMSLGSAGTRVAEPPLSVLALPQALLARITGAATAVATPIDAPIKGNEDFATPTAPAFSCATCGISVFNNVSEQRAHFSSPWHAENVRRRAKGRDTLGELDFASLSTISDSDSDSSGEEENLQSSSGSLNDSDLKDSVQDSGSPFAIMQLLPESNEDKPTALFVYKQVLYSKLRLREESAITAEEVISVLRGLQTQPQPLWTLIMFSAGHFAAGVFEAKPGTPVIRAHKVFHRYTTRRKQGGAQSASDNAKGKANSAGSNLRRHNEMMLLQEIQTLLQDWAPHIRSSSRIFIRCPPRNARKVVFFDDNLLSSSDQRVRGFPFITHRPTIPELTRAFVELTTASVREYEVPSSPKSVLKVESLHSSPKPTPPSAPVAQIAQTQQLPEWQTKCIDFCKRGKTSLLEQEITNVSTADETPQKIINIVLPFSLGTSLLHVAASAGHAETVAYLLANGADPTIREESGKQRVPYLVSESKHVRDAFRRAYARDYSDGDGTKGFGWNWGPDGAQVPSPLDEELESRQKEREREKRRKQKAKAREGAEARREQTEAIRKASEAEEARIRKEAEAKAERDRKASVYARLGKSQREAIGMTPERRMQLDREKRALAAEARFKAQQGKCSSCGKSLAKESTFEKFQYKYCSTECVKAQLVLHE
ncbi:hypothetical protein HDU84_006655 [Entophlyctis sp. JEL0112]|nr:hypothetical protein HDU84_006655 [Entophlyctis sp. JEL0112]